MKNVTFTFVGVEVIEFDNDKMDIVIGCRHKRTRGKIKKR